MTLFADEYMSLKLKKEKNVMKIKKMIVLMFVGVSLLLFGCENDGPAETAGKKIDNAAETAGKKIDYAVKNAGDKIGDAVENAGDKIKDIGDSIKDNTN